MIRTGFLLALLCSLNALAQLPVAVQPDPTAITATLKAAWAKRPDQQTLLALKPGPVDVKALSSDLQSLDFLTAGAWSFPEKKLNAFYLADAPQFDVVRLGANGAVYNFSWNAGQLTHTNFDEPPPIRQEIKTVKGEPFLEVTAYGEKELHRVVSYRDGVLVVDISYDGKPRSKQVKFREVRIAMPRQFEWTPGQKPR